MCASKQLNFFLKIYFALYFVQCFANSLAAGIGLGFPFTSFLFDPKEIFSDFVRVSYSYRMFLQDPPGSWIYHQASRLFPGLASAFDRYRSESLLNFSQNPLWASDTITHFHLPPVTQVYSLFFGRVMHDWDPYTAIALVFLFSLLPIALACLIACRRFPKYKLLLFAVTLVSYPSILSIFRGNFSSVLTSGLLLLSIVLFASRQINSATLTSALALSIRPNWYPLLLVLLFAFTGKGVIQRKLGFLLQWLFVFVSLNALALWLAHSLYPAYTLASFIKGYKLYSTAFELGDLGGFFGSSLLTAEKELFSRLLPAQVSTLAPVLRRLNIVLASIGAVWLVLIVNRKWISKERALVVAVSLTILGTPVLADYHLLVFWGPLYYAIYQSEDVNLLALSRLDLAFIALMLSPYAYYLSAHSFTSLGVILRPVLAVVYVSYSLFRASWLRTCFRTHPF
jgi:hypothetical protein